MVETRQDRPVPTNDYQVEPLDVLEAMATTRAIRRYRPDPIPAADLATMCFAASRAPSGSNRQQFRFVVLTDGPKAVEAKALLGRAFRMGWEAKKAADGYQEGSGAVPNSPKARQAAAMQHFVDHFESTPAVFLACLIRYRAANSAEGGSVYPAVQNLMLAARKLGYGGVITMWHGSVEAELRALLAIPDDVAIAATIPMGRPMGAHGPVRRRPLSEFVFADSWDNPADWAVDPPGTRHASPRRKVDPGTG
jgi:nitroreductase